MHVLRADLHLKRTAEGAEELGVQRLVAVGLRNRDVILEAAGDRFVEAVQRAQHEVARRHVLDDDAEAEHVEHIGEGKVLFAHLAKNAVEVFLAALHRGLDFVVREFFLDRFEHLADHFTTVAARRFQRLEQHVVARRIQVAEREVVEFLIDRIESQPVGNRRVDVDGLARDAFAFGWRYRIERAHVVQAVGEFDQDDAHVARHRQQHFAEILGLRFFVGFEFDAVEFGNAIDKFGHRFAELLGDFGLGDLGVFHHVVQQRGSQRLRIEMQLGEDIGNRQRMRNIRFARGAELTAVSGFAEVVRGFKPRHVLRLEIAGPFLEKGCSFRHGCSRYWIADSNNGGDSPYHNGRRAVQGLTGGGKRAVGAGAGGPRSNDYAGVLSRISTPNFCCAISRKAITVGLSRFGSTIGAAPLDNWRAR